MKIVVCIKQVPDTTEVRIDPETNTLVREGVESIVNPFDEYAIEEAIRLKEAHGGTTVALSMGPPQAADALRQAIAMGIDEAVLLSDKAFAGADTLATGYTLAKGIEKIGGVDLIICGKQAIDGDTAQVGPGIAEVLGLPFVAYVRRIDEVADDRLVVERLMDDGIEKLEMPLPGLITVVKEINEPRIPSLRGMMKAKRAEITTWSSSDLEEGSERFGLSGSPTWVVRTFTPERKAAGEIIEGEPAEQARCLLEKLRAAQVL